MYKKIITAWLCMQVGIVARSQSFAEWFEQNSTRLKYYAQQVVAWQVYLGELKNGYEICDAGLSAITGSKQGEFDLHTNYYTSLGQVNPALGQLGEIAEITTLQAAIIQRFTDALARYRRDGLLGADRLAYIGQVYGKVLQAGIADVEALSEILTAGELQMTDDQRLAKIRTLDAAMRDRYAFTLDFTDRTDVLEGQEAAELAGMGTVNGLYGL